VRRPGAWRTRRSCPPPARRSAAPDVRLHGLTEVIGRDAQQVVILCQEDRGVVHQDIGAAESPLYSPGKVADAARIGDVEDTREDLGGILPQAARGRLRQLPVPAGEQYPVSERAEPAAHL
jgi:hypothetical protein